MTDVDTSSRARRRGRGPRKAPRSTVPGANPWLEVPFVTRKVPTYDLLDDDSLARIEHSADRILAEIGMEFRDDPETVDLFRAGRRRGHADRPGHVDHPLRARPDPAPVFDRATTVPPGGTQPRPLGRDRGRRDGLRAVLRLAVHPRHRRPPAATPTLADFQALVKLGQSSPWLHHSGGHHLRADRHSVNKRHLDMVYAHIRYSDKPFMGSITAPERAADSIEMCRLLFGSDFVDGNCVILGNFNTTSPLVLDGVTTRGIRTYARRRAGQDPPAVPAGRRGPRRSRWREAARKALPNRWSAWR